MVIWKKITNFAVLYLCHSERSLCHDAYVILSEAKNLNKNLKLK